MCKNKLHHTLQHNNTSTNDTLEQCATILNKGKKKYDNEQVKIIRQYLYLLAELQIENEKIAFNKKTRINECKM